MAKKREKKEKDFSFLFSRDRCDVYRNLGDNNPLHNPETFHMLPQSAMELFPRPIVYGILILAVAERHLIEKYGKKEDAPIEDNDTEKKKPHSIVSYIGSSFRAVEICDVFHLREGECSGTLVGYSEGGGDSKLKFSLDSLLDPSQFKEKPAKDTFTSEHEIPKEYLLHHLSAAGYSANFKRIPHLLVASALSPHLIKRGEETGSGYAFYKKLSVQFYKDITDIKLPLALELTSGHSVREEMGIRRHKFRTKATSEGKLLFTSDSALISIE